MLCNSVYMQIFRASLLSPDVLSSSRCRNVLNVGPTQLVRLLDLASGLVLCGKTLKHNDFLIHLKPKLDRKEANKHVLVRD